MKSYYQEKNITIYHGDCLDILPCMESKKMDMILTDPPYGITSCNWDIVIPLKSMWKELKRVIKSNRAIVLMASQPFTTLLIASNIKMFKYCWVWVKTKASGHLDAKRKPMKKHEDISVFGDKGYPNYYPQGLIDGVFKTGRNVNMTGRIYGQYKNHIYSKKGNYPKSVLEFSNPSSKGHLYPTQKPVSLMEYLIKTYTNENDIVLDFAMGSGTTLVAAKNLGRQAIGIDIEEKSCEIAAKRLSQETKDILLFES